MHYKRNDRREKTLYSMLQNLPQAAAVINGDSRHGQINGIVKFYQARQGVWVVADILGLPVSREMCGNNIFAFHVHKGALCTGNEEDPFADASNHYDTRSCPHPYHSGDMPPLFAAGGNAFLAFFTDRFSVNEILGKTVIIHDGVDDFTSQPSGNAGNKIACGVISSVRR